MWLKADRAALACAALVGLSGWALWAPVTAHAGMPPAKQAAQQPAKAASVCPVRAHTTVRQIDLFDGPPADLAYLAPADPDRAPNLYPVREVYQQGRIVTIRCQPRSISAATAKQGANAPPPWCAAEGTGPLAGRRPLLIKPQWRRCAAGAPAFCEPHDHPRHRPETLEPL
jgi:hypothetical protein